MTFDPMHRHLRLLIVPLLIALGGHASAQTTETPKAALFLTLALGSEVSSVFYEHKGKTIPLQASLATISRIYETDVSRQVSIFRLLPSKDPLLPPERQVLAKLSLPPDSPHLLLFTGNADPTKISVKAIEDSWEIHPENTFRLINDSRRTVAIRLGDEEGVLRPGENSVFKAAGKGYDFDFKAATLENGGWVLRIQSPQSIVPRTRATIVIYDQLPSRENPAPEDLVVASFIDAQRITKP